MAGSGRPINVALRSSSPASSIAATVSDAKPDTAPAKQDLDPSAKTGTAGAAAPATLSSCLEPCYDAKLSPTDKATCRLNCDSAFRPKLPGSTAAVDDRADPVNAAASCLSGCYAKEGALDVGEDAPDLDLVAAADDHATLAKTYRSSITTSVTFNATVPANSRMPATSMIKKKKYDIPWTA